MHTVSVTPVLFEPHRTVLRPSGVAEVVLAAGADDLAANLFHHDPPLPGELEAAIDVVEDALAATGLRQADRGVLQVNEPVWGEWLGGCRPDEPCARDLVEAQFQRLASTSLGYPGFVGGTALAAARLLILRECMHHLGYEAVVYQRCDDDR